MARVRGWRAARLHDSTGHGRPHTQCQRPTTVAQFQTTSDALSAAHTTPRARVPCARERVALEERPACDVPKAIHAPRPPGVVLHTPRATHEWCCDAPHRRAMMGACAQGWKQECGWRRTSAQEQRAGATADAPASHGGRKRGFPRVARTRGSGGTAPTRTRHLDKASPGGAASCSGLGRPDVFAGRLTRRTFDPERAWSAAASHQPRHPPPATISHGV